MARRKKNSLKKVAVAIGRTLGRAESRARRAQKRAGKASRRLKRVARKARRQLRVPTGR